MREADASPYEPPPGEDRATEGWPLRLIPRWVTPNQLTVFRMGCTTAMLAVELANGPLGWIIALGFVAGLSDLADGMVARGRGMVTKLGTFLDPVGDKYLALVGALVVWQRGLVPLWLLLLLLATELHSVLIPLASFAARAWRGRPLWPPPKVEANRWGKLKTGWVAFALGFVMIGAWGGWEWLEVFACLNLVGALGMGLVAEWHYFVTWQRGEFD